MKENSTGRLLEGVEFANFTWRVESGGVCARFGVGTEAKHPERQATVHTSVHHLQLQQRKRENPREEE
jgi:hypothetical protein